MSDPPPPASIDASPDASPGTSSAGRGLRDFDYFDEHPAPLAAGEPAAQLEAEEQGLQARVREYRAQQSRARVHLLVSLAFLGLSGYLAYDLRADLAWALASPGLPAQDLGHVEDVELAALAHNRHVRLRGVSDHRAASVRRLRGFDWRQREFWYLHLSGSRVFVEAPAGRPDLGPLHELDVTGRVLDTRVDRRFDSVLEHMRAVYLYDVGDNARVLQADYPPGSGRWHYLALFTLLGAMSALNVYHAARRRQQARRVLGPAGPPPSPAARPPAATT